MECPRVFSGCPNETIHSATPYSINLPVHATLFAPHRQVPSVLRNAGMLLGSLRSATRDRYNWWNSGLCKFFEEPCYDRKESFFKDLVKAQLRAVLVRHAVYWGGV